MADPPKRTAGQEPQVMGEDHPNRSRRSIVVRCQRPPGSSCPRRGREPEAAWLHPERRLDRSVAPWDEEHPGGLRVFLCGGEVVGHDGWMPVMPGRATWPAQAPALPPAVTGGTRLRLNPVTASLAALAAADKSPLPYGVDQPSTQRGDVSVLSGVPEAEAAERLEQQDWLERARAGDTRAYRDLVRVHQDAIFGLVARLVRDRLLAEEITQDVFLKAYRSLGSFRGDSRFSTWLYRIAVNLCHDHHASVAARIRRNETGLETGTGSAHEPWSSTPAPDDALVAREAAEAFQAGLDALESPYREAFVLRHQDDLGYDEIAEVFGISRNNAKVRVHRAREMILGALRKLGYEF